MLRFDVESRVVQGVPAQFSRTLTVLAFDSSFHFGVGFYTLYLQLLLCLSINRLVVQDIDSFSHLSSRIASHLSFLNFTSSVIGTFLDQLSFVHWNPSSTCSVSYCILSYFLLPIWILSSVTEKKMCLIWSPRVRTTVASKSNTDALDILINAFY